MHLLRISTGIIAIAALSGCASAPPAVESVPAPSSNDRAAAVAAAGTPVRWQGNFQATQQRTGMAAPTSQNKTTGSIFLAQAGADRARVRITLSTDLRNVSQMQWGIVPGRCGSVALPLVALQRFPVIEIGGNSRGELDMEMPLTLPTSGSYHANVYNGGTQLNNVVSCANLAMSGGNRG
ncbi:MAG TPA: hypothetical protein VMY38_09480 [Gemmatimonadaceae bacterium]|nr:hypothetical protein [Gemmatimonadaceae bacterium]